MRSLRRRKCMWSRARRCYGRVISRCCRGEVLVCQLSPSAVLKLLGIVTPLRYGVRRHKTEAGGEFVGALQRSLALFKTGTVIPELIIKGRIALDNLPT